MSTIIQQLETAQIRTDIPEFRAGDTIVVQMKVKEGNRQRLQAFEGVVIAKSNRGLNSAFTVRKISSGEGVERVFQMHSPLIESVVVKRRGDVRKAKLYSLRMRKGRAAKIKEKRDFKNNKDTKTKSVNETENALVTEESAALEEPSTASPAESADADKTS